MDLDAISRAIRARLDAKHAARERALAASRRAIRACANAIRAIHRGEFEPARALLEEARAAIEEGREAVRDHPDVGFAGHLQDAQKEYAEARITEALVTGAPIPSPEELGVEDAPYLNGMAEAIGEGRRHILDLLRVGDVDRGEAVLSAIDDLYYVLVSMDYPDAITMNLRRSTDVARGLVERTRGDLSVGLVSRSLRDALDRHAREVRGGEPGEGAG
ncbi:MAG TPA: haloacid dehalogenase [Actinomycetota bacterium]|nr:haloacid dehalogenase [Actinomycetota bacterium]